MQRNTREYYKYSVEALAGAIAEAKKGFDNEPHKRPTTKSIARKYGVPSTSLRAVLLKGGCAARKIGLYSILTASEEKCVVEWCLKRVRVTKEPIDTVSVRKKIQKILDESKEKRDLPLTFKNNFPPRAFVISFLKRHPEIKIRKNNRHEGENLEKALAEIEQNYKETKHRQMAHVSKKYNIPLWTLLRRMKGIGVETRGGPRSIFTHDEEKSIANWAIKNAQQGHQITCKIVCLHAKTILDKDPKAHERRVQYPDNLPAVGWFRSFIRRFPQVHSHIYIPNKKRMITNKDKENEENSTSNKPTNSENQETTSNKKEILVIDLEDESEDETCNWLMSLNPNQFLEELD